jgi:hypothetical protein
LRQGQKTDDSCLFLLKNKNRVFPATSVVTFKVTYKGEIVVFFHKLNVKLQNKYNTEADVVQETSAHVYAANCKALKGKKRAPKSYSDANSRKFILDMCGYLSCWKTNV